ncbi:hypothetical protein J8V43_03375, partial [Photorhabdus laumondii]|uniref:hypothetical protein n=1 Tax=Photorhabdus laumondii TaxID=2218628 RepID=UPI001E390FD6
SINLKSVLPNVFSFNISYRMKLFTSFKKSLITVFLPLMIKVFIFFHDMLVFFPVFKATLTGKKRIFLTNTRFIII